MFVNSRLRVTISISLGAILTIVSAAIVVRLFACTLAHNYNVFGKNLTIASLIYSTTNNKPKINKLPYWQNIYTMAWSRDGYTCWDCAFYMEGKCEQKAEKVKADKLPCRDFELG